MMNKYQLTPQAMWHIRRLPPEAKNLLASSLSRVGYAAGTSIRENWKADFIPHEVAVKILAKTTGLPEWMVVEKVKVNILKRGRHFNNR
jgi:hypothetical protein